MGLFARLIRHAPYASHIAAVGIGRPLHPDTIQLPIIRALSIECSSAAIASESRFGIRFELLLEVVSLRLGEKEYLFEVHRKAIADGRRDTSRLIPNDFIAQHPAPQDHFVGKFVRDVAQRFGWNAVTRRIDLDVYEAIVILRTFAPLRILPAVVLVGFAVRIAQVHPQRTGGFQHAAALVEDHTQVRDELLARRLQPQLSRPAVRPHDRADAVIAHLPVRRRRDDAVHRFVGQQFQTRQGVAIMDCVQFHLFYYFCEKHQP